MVVRIIFILSFISCIGYSQVRPLDVHRPLHAKDTVKIEKVLELPDGTLIDNGNDLGGVEEAPNDGSIYGRQDESWTIIPSGGDAGAQIQDSLHNADSIYARVGVFDELYIATEDSSGGGISLPVDSVYITPSNITSGDSINITTNAQYAWMLDFNLGSGTDYNYAGSDSITIYVQYNGVKDACMSMPLSWIITTAENTNQTKPFDCNRDTNGDVWIEFPSGITTGTKPIWINVVRYK